MSVCLGVRRLTYPSLKLRIGDDLQPGAAQHGFRRGAVRDPPIRLIAGVFLLDEVHAWEARLGKNLAVPEVIVVFGAVDAIVAAQHRLEDELMPDLGGHLVECVQRIPQVIEDTHEEDKIELPRDLIDVVDRALLELDLMTQSGGCKARLVEIAIVYVDPEDPAGAPLFHLDGIEATVAPNVEDGRAGKIRRDGARDVLTLDIREVAEKMLRRGGHAKEIDVVEPLS